MLFFFFPGHSVPLRQAKNHFRSLRFTQVILLCSSGSGLRSSNFVPALRAFFSIIPALSPPLRQARNYLCSLRSRGLFLFVSVFWPFAYLNQADFFFPRFARGIDLFLLSWPFHSTLHAFTSQPSVVDVVKNSGGACSCHFRTDLLVFLVSLVFSIYF